MSNEQDRYKRMVESSQDWFWAFDEHANFTYVSPKIKDLLGYEPEEIVGINAFDLMDADEAESVHRHFDPIAKKYLPFKNLVNINRHKEGHEVVIESSGTPVFNEEGQFQGYQGVDRDITERKQIEEELIKSQQLLTDMGKISKVGGWEFNVGTELLQWTQEVYRIHEVGLDYVPTVENALDFYSDASKTVIAEAVQRAIEHGEPFDLELDIVTAKGNLRHVHAIGMADLEHRKVHGIFQDITERKKIEESLQKGEILFRDFFELNPIATIISSPSGLVHMTNAAFTVTTGFSAEEVVGKNTLELGFWRDPDVRQTMIRAIQERGFINNLESEFFGKGNLPMTCLISSRAIEHEGEMRILSTVIDVTLQREAAKALRKLDQAKSDFIATAAHELRTPLVAILGYAELLENATQLRISAQEQQSYSSIILSNAEILTRLTDDLFDVEQIQLDRPFRIKQEKTSLCNLINEALTSFTLKCPHHRFILTHADSLPEVMWIDSVRINQVLNNLLDNAVKYSPDGQVVEVLTETDETQISISIRDQGVGMTNEEVEQVFQRFYRAKPTNAVAQGLGLGMCIVKRIVEDHGGEIYITSQPGAGTTAKFTLPIKTVVETESR